MMPKTFCNKYKYYNKYVTNVITNTNPLSHIEHLAIIQIEIEMMIQYKKNTNDS